MWLWEALPLTASACTYNHIKRSLSSVLLPGKAKRKERKKKRLTDTRASVTLVSTAGRKEWTRILCSVTASTSRVAAFFGPRFSNNVERLPPLRHKKTHTQINQTRQQQSIHVLILYFTHVSLPERQWRGHRLAQHQAVMWRQLLKTHGRAFER